ncbi:TPA: prepilin-type cleavage/methylation domain-containing protein [Candidatus Saccharibacteria bacterium]|nr:MAG: hypothetical protein UW38_C0001G0884 [Candidatus Saccharibacteria bacterium GW2011_GWC2_44_17]OGL33479.1 MAG: hypothetical protein A3E20_01685 [Candidatus Saccharibacteria bacterium RIFCSPHIGHO2_12_FULL_47_16]HBH77284.1 prepilin-type cleavage/methylation domain-containing protein [Candidatus Saccharibacteria bacterium]
MNAVSKNKQSGFTIIEVVLVLAIAGLIFLMVFVALPTLQRNQRDTQRKQDMSRITTAVASYTQNNKGALPDDQAKWTNFMEKYLKVDGDAFADPTFGSYSLSYKALSDTATPSTPVSETGIINVYPQRKCNGESLETGQKRNVAFAMKLEGGGVACQSY